MNTEISSIKAEDDICQMKYANLATNLLKANILLKAYANTHVFSQLLIQSLDKPINSETEYNIIQVLSAIIYHIDLDSITKLFSILSAKGSHNNLLQLFELVRLPLNPESYLNILKSCLSTLNSQKARDVINFMIQEKVIISESHMSLAIEVCSKSGYMTECFDLIKQMEEISLLPNAEIYSIIIRGYAKLKDIDKAFSVFKELTEKGMYINGALCLNSILENCIKSDRPEIAIEIFEYHLKTEGASSSLDIISFSTIVKAYSRHCSINDFNNIDDLEPKMKSLNIIPDEVYYNTLLDAYSKSFNLEMALKVFQNMSAKGVKPSVVTYNSLIDAYVRNNASEKAWNVLDEMKKDGIDPDNFTYSTLIKSIKEESQISDLEKAFKLLESIKNEGKMKPDEILYNVLLDACISVKQLDKAIQLIEIMKKPDNCVKPDVISFNTIIKGCGHSKNMKLAFEVFEDMKNQNIAPNDVTYNSLIDVCVRCSNISRAWTLLNDMELCGLMPDNYSYSTIIKGLKKDHSNPNSYLELEKAFDLLKSMKEKGRIRPDEILYNCLMDACIRFGNSQKAEDLFHEMINSEIKASSVTYGILIKSYGLNNKLDKSFETFKQMKELNYVPNAVTYGCLIDACIKNNRVDKALEVFERMNKDKVKPNTIIYTTLIKGFSKTQQLEKALNIFELMKADPKSTPNNVTFNSLLDCCVKCDYSMQKTNKIFMEMQEIGINPDLITYSTLIKGYCKDGSINKALSLLDQMKSKGIIPDEVLYNSLLDGCCKCNEFDMAFTIFDSMNSQGVIPSNITYSILIKIYGRMQNLTKALEIIDLMFSKGITPGKIAFTCLIKICIKQKRMQKAIEIFKKMIGCGVQPDDISFSTLISGCLQNRKALDAAEISIMSFDSGIVLKPSLYNSVLFSLSSLIGSLVKEKINQLANLMMEQKIQVDSKIKNKYNITYIEKVSSKPIPKPIVQIENSNLSNKIKANVNTTEKVGKPDLEISSIPEKSKPAQKKTKKPTLNKENELVNNANEKVARMI